MLEKRNTISEFWTSFRDAYSIASKLGKRTINSQFSTSSEDIESVLYQNIITTQITDRDSKVSYSENRSIQGELLWSFHKNKFTGRLNGLYSYTEGALVHERDFIEDKMEGYAVTYNEGKIVNLARYEKGINLGITVLPDLDTIESNVKPETVLSSIKRRIQAGTLTL